MAVATRGLRLPRAGECQPRRAPHGLAVPTALSQLDPPMRLCPGLGHALLLALREGSSHCSGWKGAAENFPGGAEMIVFVPPFSLGSWGWERRGLGM